MFAIADSGKPGKIKYQENTLKQGQLVVFHGLNREGFKGTGYKKSF